MTDIASRAVAASVYFEAKKTGFGQAQDGWSLTLRIAHLDMPPAVRDAPKGTRYIVALVEIGDDEEPVVRESATRAAAPAVAKGGAVAETSPGAAPPTSRTPRNWKELPYAARAGILCADPVFWQYLGEVFGLTPASAEVAAADMRKYCDVKSRSDFDKSVDAAGRYATMERNFLDYKNRGEHQRAAQ